MKIQKFYSSFLALVQDFGSVIVQTDLDLSRPLRKKTHLSGPEMMIFLVCSENFEMELKKTIISFLLYNETRSFEGKIAKKRGGSEDGVEGSGSPTRDTYQPLLEGES